MGFTLPPQQTVLDATKFSVNTSYAHIAQRIDLCDIATRARSMGVVPAGFEVQERDGKSDSVTKGTVIGTEPEADTESAPGSPVTIIRSAGA